MLIINPQEKYRAALRYYIEKQGWGGEYATALKANISQPTLNRIKKGKRDGKLNTLAKIAGALDTTYEDMLELGNLLLNGDQREKQIEITQVIMIAKQILESEEEDMAEMLKQNILDAYNIIKERKKK